jgi:hypothetical protein
MYLLAFGGLALLLLVGEDDVLVRFLLGTAGGLVGGLQVLGTRDLGGGERREGGREGGREE